MPGPKCGSTAAAGCAWIRPRSSPQPADQGELDELLPASASPQAARAWRAGSSASSQAWQAVNAWWQDQFVNFNANRQLALLGRLGFKAGDYQTLVALLALGGAIWLSFLAWRGRGLADGKPRDALGRSWRRLERSLRRRISARAPHEGPVAYGERLAGERPEFAASVRLLTREYAQLRYGRGCDDAAVQRFDRAVRQFSARPARARATAATRR